MTSVHSRLDVDTAKIDQRKKEFNENTDIYIAIMEYPSQNNFSI